MKYNKGDQLLLDDDINYIVSDSLSYDGNNYYFLTYYDDKMEEQFVILKEELENNDVLLVNLDSEDEFDTLFFLFGKKNSNT